FPCLKQLTVNNLTP
ncbi:unnamed protein product, partial [Rotaria sordida]